MRIIDLTHTISEKMPVYPGTERPKLTPASSYDSDGFKETLLSMYSHTGTHADPPAHIFPGRTELDEFPPERFVGKAVVVDCTSVGEGGLITMEEVSACGALAREAEFLLFRTGWDAYWNDERYFSAYPVIDEEVLKFVLETGKKGIGFDTIGVDPISDGMLSIHRKLFNENEIINIENLTKLGECGEGAFLFCALPLKWAHSDGAPVRAIAILDV